MVLSYIWQPLKPVFNQAREINGKFPYLETALVAIGNSVKIGGRVITIAGGTALTALASEYLLHSHISAVTSRALIQVAQLGSVVTMAGFSIPLLTSMVTISILVTLILVDSCKG